ncbi:MAG: tRNA-dihydrouridine synthase family protein [Desulforhopalus sp.]
MEQQSNHKKISVRGLKIWPPIALAPMVGLTHSAFRTLVLREGGVGLLFTEMLAAKRLPHDNSNVSPLLARSIEERPLFYQLIVADPQHIVPAVTKIHCMDPQGIDLNLGCPAPVQRKQGAGATLAKNHRALCKVLGLLRKSTDLPLSVKIRLGEVVDPGALRRFCAMLESEGVDLITIHARLYGEKFCRKPRWSIIGEVKDSVSVPVLANGGIFSLVDARRCLALSEADGLMVGRGAIVRPWLCREIAEKIYGLAVPNPLRTREELFFEFISLLEKQFAPERRLGRLKQFTHYFASSFTFGHHFTTAIQTSTTMSQASVRAQKYFSTRKRESFPPSLTGVKLE